MANHPTFQPDPTLYPFKSRWLDASCGRVHYVDEGEGAPLLFLHGNATWSFLWRDVIVALRPRFRCLAVDFPGFGLSDHPEEQRPTPADHADVVNELVDGLDLKNLTIVGHDWGGPIGMRVALDQRDRLRALVMSNTWYWPADRWHMRAYSRLWDSDPMQAMIVKRNWLVERLLPSGTRTHPTEAVMDHYRRALPTPESRSCAAALPGQMVRSSFWLGEIAHAAPRMLRDVPLLLAWGVHDLAFPPGFMDRFRRDFAQVTVERLDAGHYAQEDAAGPMADAIGRFLTEAPAERSAA